jgi:hypothetical protein
MHNVGYIFKHAHIYYYGYDICIRLLTNRSLMHMDMHQVINESKFARYVQHLFLNLTQV